MIYLCRQEYKFLGEWKLYHDEEERNRQKLLDELAQDSKK